jgi:branched-chain amino acid transport system ATP-binding protein
MTVLENLKTGMRDQSDTKQVESVFSLFPILQERLSQLAGTLSGGEQQALAISRALIKRPDIILLDEPTTGLMPIFVFKLKEIIKRLNENGMAILLVEEKIPFALSIADQVYFLVKGRIEYRASREELQGKREILIRYLGVEV